MALNPRQQLTIEHLNYNYPRSTEDIVSWCRNKLRQTRRKQGVGGYINRRKHSKAHYQGIIEALT